MASPIKDVVLECEFKNDPKKRSVRYRYKTYKSSVNDKLVSIISEFVVEPTEDPNVKFEVQSLTFGTSSEIGSYSLILADNAVKPITQKRIESQHVTFFPKAKEAAIARMKHLFNHPELMKGIPL